MRSLLTSLTKLGTVLHVVLSTAIFVFFVSTILPAQSVSNAEFNQGERVPDLRVTYSADTLYGLAETYGEEGRAKYITSKFTLDLAWPLAYTYFYMALIAFTFRRMCAPESPWHERGMWMAVLPIVFDIGENICTGSVMAAFPDTLTPVAWLAGGLTLIKWIAVAVANVAYTVGIVGALFSLRKRTADA
jgi:hypothetical protein